MRSPRCTTNGSLPWFISGTLQLAAVVRVDRPGGVEHGDAVPEGEPRSRPHLALNPSGTAMPSRSDRAGHSPGGMVISASIAAQRSIPTAPPVWYAGSGRSSADAGHADADGSAGDHGLRQHGLRARARRAAASSAASDQAGRGPEAGADRSREAVEGAICWRRRRVGARRS